MITALLVAVDSSAYARAAQEHAVALGKAYQARVTGLYVLDIRYVEMPPYVDYSYTFEAVPPIIAPLDVMEKFRAKSERILSDFREFVSKAGLPVDTRTEEGVPSQVIADLGARTTLSSWANGVSTPSGAAIFSGRPRRAWPGARRRPSCW